MLKERHQIQGHCGNFKFARTTYSLIKALSGNKGSKFILISTKELEISVRWE